LNRWAELYDGERIRCIAEEKHIGALIGNVTGLQTGGYWLWNGTTCIRLAAAAGAKVTALDFSEGMLERARAKPGADA